jgi:hypothetical protein
MAASFLSPVAELSAAQGSPTYLGTYDATGTSKTNSQATTPFGHTGDFLTGKVLLVHNAGSVAVRIHPVAASYGTVTTNRTGNHGVYVEAGEKATLRMAQPYLAVITTSSTANVDVWELT